MSSCVCVCMCVYVCVDSQLQLSCMTHCARVQCTVYSIQHYAVSLQCVCQPANGNHPQWYSGGPSGARCGSRGEQREAGRQKRQGDNAEAGGRSRGGRILIRLLVAVICVLIGLTVNTNEVVGGDRSRGGPLCVQ